MIRTSYPKQEVPHINYKMTISRMTVDKLGVKLYDRVYAVIAEMISNSYDADAEVVTVRAPMGQFLASKIEGKVISKRVTIEIIDNGTGMSPQELQDFYLVVGKERRDDPKRGDVSKKYERKVMGRKGVGKLAPFGVCRIVEIISSGGELVSEEGQTGYRVAHVILDRSQILSDTDSEYPPEVGDEDGKLYPDTGTRIILRDFEYRRVGNIDELARQLSQRFGISSSNWQIRLEDSSKTGDDPESSRIVGAFDVPVMANSKVMFNGPQPTASRPDKTGYGAMNPDGSASDKLSPGFFYEGKFYPVVGWVAYAKEPYKDELMAGVRIYCRGKFSAQTTVFNHKAGFTGEHNVRSYLVGAICADWLDEGEDLIQTDRRDILWSHELGTAFQSWGQNVIKHVGLVARDPMRKTMAEQFLSVGNIEERVQTAFPNERQKELRSNALNVAKMLGRSLRGDELTDPQAVEDMVQLTLLLAPLQTLDIKLREASEEDITPLSVVTDILRTAKVAETVSFGRIVEKRLEIIKHLDGLKDIKETVEDELQKLIEAAPWLVNPQWVPVTANQSLKTLKKEFAKYFKEKTGEDIHLSDFSEPTKRPDFVLFSQDGKLQIIEIKKPKHRITNVEMDRIVTYVQQFSAFFNDERHGDFRNIASDFHLTLVADGHDLSGAQLTAYESYVEKKRLTPINWPAFLLRATRTHQVFLEEAELLRGADFNDA